MPFRTQLSGRSLIAALALLSLLFTACNDDSGNGPADTNAGTDTAISALRQATGIAWNTISIPKHAGAAQRNADGSYNMSDFVIDMDQIKKTIVNEKVTYSFSIMPKVVTSRSDFNLIVFNNGGGWDYSVMELQHDNPDNPSPSFKGNIKELYSTAARGTGCFTLFMEFTHCTHTGSCASGTCDRCSLCVDYVSVRLCKDETEQYLSEGLVENPDYGGGGSGVHTGPQPIHVDPGAYVFEPNIKATALAELRKVRAAAFYNALSAEQQQWAEAHPDSYDSLLDYYLDHYSPTEEFYFIEMIDSFINSDSEYSADGFMGDDDEGNEDYNGPKENIPHSITLNDGSVVTVVFGSTESDNKSADNPVATDLVDAVTQALNQANENLGANDKITSIYIKATTNGSHGPNSNHSKGTALDISRINGDKIAVLGNNVQVQALQQGFDTHPKIRENFGPTFKHKKYADGTQDTDYEIAGHQDHVHVSVQSN